jgi:predicted Zn-dependent protease
MTRALLFACLCGLATGTAQAQFNLDINRLIDTAKSIGQANTEIDQQGELEIGRDVAPRLLGAAPLHPDASLQRYVNEIGRWLASHTERADLPWHFAVLDAPQVNAFATPGGYIFVTGGLVGRMRTEAELAGVLAHEIVHVLRKHHLKAIQKGALANVASNVVALAIQDRNSALRNQLVSFGTELYVRGLDKSDELEADRLGVVIAARGGYDPWGLAVVLQTLQSINPEDSAVALMFKTHPAPTERLDALEQRMLPMLEAYAAQPQLGDRFLASVGGGRATRR